MFKNSVDFLSGVNMICTASVSVWLGLYIRGEGWLGFPDLWYGQRPWWNWCFNPCGKFGWSPEGPVSQIHSPHLLVGAPGIFSDLLRSVQMLKRVGCGKQREATAPIKSLVKLQPWFLSLRWNTCLRQNYSIGFSACSEGRAFGQNTLIYLFIYLSYKKYSLLPSLVISQDLFSHDLRGSSRK